MKSQVATEKEKFIPEDDFPTRKKVLEEMGLKVHERLYESVMEEKEGCRCVTGGHGGYVYCPIHSKKEKKGSVKDWIKTNRGMTLSKYNIDELKRILCPSCSNDVLISDGGGK